MIVAGDNFGCGSSREQAPLAIQAAGVACVVARSFARIFYRNAINVGLPILEVPDHRIEPGARLAVDVGAGEVRDETAGRTYRAAPLPPIMLAILDAGGLVPYLREHGDFVGRRNGERGTRNGAVGRRRTRDHRRRQPAGVHVVGGHPMSSFRTPQSPFRILQDLRVLEFTHAVMGPTAGLVLADLGAEVIHVEPPGGDSTRPAEGVRDGLLPVLQPQQKVAGRGPSKTPTRSKPSSGWRRRRTWWSRTSAGDDGPARPRLRRARGGERAADLLLAEGFLPGPYESRHAMDEVVQMMGGLAYMTGPPGQPLRAGTSVVDITGGMFGVIGVLAAAPRAPADRARQLVKAALFETTAFLMGQHMAYSALVDHPRPADARARVSAWGVYRTFETADDDLVFLGIISEKHWERFAEAFDRPDWLDDSRLATNNDRIDAREWFLPDVERTIRQHSKAETIRRAEGAGHPVPPIARPERTCSRTSQLAAGALVSQGLPSGDRADLPKTPLVFGDARPGLRSDPPAVGADTADLLRQSGLGKADVAALAERGAAPGRGLTDAAPS